MSQPTSTIPTPVRTWRRPLVFSSFPTRNDDDDADLEDLIFGAEDEEVLRKD
jgi:hypothetical protein